MAVGRGCKWGCSDNTCAATSALFSSSTTDNRRLKALMQQLVASEMGLSFSSATTQSGAISSYCRPFSVCCLLLSTLCYRSFHRICSLSVLSQCCLSSLQITRCCAAPAAARRVVSTCHPVLFLMICFIGIHLRATFLGNLLLSQSQDKM